MPKFIGASKVLTSPCSSGSASRATISPEAYHPLSTWEMKKQLSYVGVVSVEQSASPGLRILSPVLVSYHW